MLINNVPNISDAFRICFYISDDTQIQWFQFRLLHRILPVNSYLKTIGIKPTDTCWFCDEIEDYIHAFVSCPNVLQIWSKLSFHIHAKTNLRIGFNVCNIIFGEPFAITNIPINFVILYAKLFIFKCLKKEEIVHFCQLIKFIHFHYKIEKYNAVKNKKIDSFMRIWNEWEIIFHI